MCHCLEIKVRDGSTILRPFGGLFMLDCSLAVSKHFCTIVQSIHEFSVDMGHLNVDHQWKLIIYV